MSEATRLYSYLDPILSGPYWIGRDFYTQTCFLPDRSFLPSPETGYLHLGQISGNPKADSPIPLIIPVS